MSDSSSSSDATAVPSADPVTQVEAHKPDFKVYKPSSRASPAIPNLPDEYYKPTTADIKAAQAQLIARREGLVNAPLRLRAQREAEAKAKLDRWPETKIRIKFTDGTQVEKVFLSTNKIKAVYNFVRGCLREEVKTVMFTLYQPPKRDLMASDPKVRDLTLGELQLAPSSVLLLRFELDTLNKSNVRAPLNPSFLADAIDLPAPPPIVVENHSGPSSKKNSQTSTSTGSESKGVKIPTWLKLGQKK